MQINSNRLLYLGKYGEVSSHYQQSLSTCPIYLGSAFHLNESHCSGCQVLIANKPLKREMFGYPTYGLTYPSST